MSIEKVTKKPTGCPVGFFVTFSFDDDALRVPYGHARLCGDDALAVYGEYEHVFCVDALAVRRQG
jgi:hypothetical protein